MTGSSFLLAYVPEDVKMVEGPCYGTCIVLPMKIFVNTKTGNDTDNDTNKDTDNDTDNETDNDTNTITDTGIFIPIQIQVNIQMVGH